MKKIFLILLMFVCLTSYVNAEEKAPLPLCDDLYLIEKLSDKIKEVYNKKNIGDDLYSRRQRKLFLKNLSSLAEIRVEEINKNNFDFYSKYTELKVNKNLSLDDIRICNLKDNKKLNKIYIFIYNYKDETYVDFVNFNITAYRKLNTMKL